MSGHHLLYTLPAVQAWAREHLSLFSPHALNRLAEDARRALGREAGPAALTLTRLWQKHRDKLPTWNEFLGDPEAFEQASGERAARWRSARFSPFGIVLDLCCGAGADAVALSLAAGQVIAVDWNFERLTCARANVTRYGMPTCSNFLCADVREHLPAGEAVLLDPDRRTGRGRAIHPGAYSPPPETWERIRARVPDMAVKAAPGISYDDIPADAVPEFLEDRGECREAVLWFGSLRPRARSATVLSGGCAGAPLRGESIAADEPESNAIGRVGSVMYDPGPATVRAHLVTHLAARLGARRIDERIAYLTGDEMVLTPFAAAFRVEAVWPFHVRRLTWALRERRIGALEIRTRRFPLRPDDLRRQLALSGDRQATLILTRIRDDPVAVLCERVIP